MDSLQPFKKKRRLIHDKWKRKRREGSHLDQVMPESDSLKRLKRKDPDDAEEESPEPVPLTVEDVPNTANSLSIPPTTNFFPIFSRKPPTFFKADPPKFNAKPLSKEVENPPRRKQKAKAKKHKPKTGTETTNKITNYFGGTAAADDTSDPP